jgi:pre-mRNA-splicing helicase BRR2
MADAPKFKHFEYRSNQAMVLQQENRPRRHDEPSGAPESLLGRLSGRMGDRAAANEKPAELEKLLERRKQRQDDARSKKRGGKHDVLAEELLEGISYRPKTRETKAAYEQLLRFVEAFLGDQALPIIMSAADEVLVLLKTDDVRPADRLREINAILNAQVSQERFADLLKIVKGITDFTDETAMAVNADGTAEEMGISVVVAEVCFLSPIAVFEHHFIFNTSFCITKF